MAAACAWAAGAVISIHLLFIFWVAGGALLTRGRNWASGLHIACLVYGIVIEVGPWACPLTWLEGHFERCSGEAGYQGSFLLHYLQRLVYPDFPNALLITAAVVVCGGNLWVYARRWRIRSGGVTTPPQSAD